MRKLPLKMEVLLLVMSAMEKSTKKLVYTWSVKGDRVVAADYYFDSVSSTKSL